MDRLATPDEGRLLTAYYDEIAPCRQQRVEVISKQSPELATLVSETNAEVEAATLGLIKRQITWLSFHAQADKSVAILKQRARNVAL